MPNKVIINKSKKINTTFLERDLLIKNPLNLLFAHLEILDFPAIVILSYTRPDRPNAAAIAAVAVDFFNIYFQLEISTTQLQSNA